MPKPRRKRITEEDTTPLEPYWSSADGKLVRLYLGDVVDVLKRMPDKSVQTVVTSPPYWGLRDYGTAEWEGGDDGCDHDGGRGEKRTKNIQLEREKDREGYDGAFARKIDMTVGGKTGSSYSGKVCKKCGAKRVDQQIGSEETIDEFVAKMVEVFREVKRVLRDDGTLWLNLGDSYCGGASGAASYIQDGKKRRDRKLFQGKYPKSGLPCGNLVGAPWRVALALQADGWVLRQDIIWAKPSPMPESVRNRCTKAHEYLFLLTKKGSGYFYDADAVRVPLKQDPEAYAKMLESKQRQKSSQLGSSVNAGAGSKTDGFNSFISDGKTSTYIPSGANRRSVWNIASESYDGAHFATFPRKLVTPCILAGSSEKGCCAVCGAPWKRVVEKEKYVPSVVSVGVRNVDISRGDKTRKLSGPEYNKLAPGKTVGWEPTCECFGKFKKRRKLVVDEDGEEKVVRYVEYVPRIPLEDHKVVPCVVLDPFVGSGTVCVVALVNGRRSVGIDLSEKYLKKNAITRIKGTMLGVPKLAGLVGEKVKRMRLGAKKVPTMRGDKKKDERQ